MRLLLEPRLVNDAFGDPCLYVDCRDQRRALMFDLGDIAALPPRKLLRLSHVFVSHTHMDHFSGFDTLLRVVLGRKRAITLWGGPGFIDQVEHKLRAYTWNVVHRYEVELVIDAHQVEVDGRRRQARFSSLHGFERETLADPEPAGDLLLDELLLRVRARFVDHGLPCLAFAVEEKARVKVAKDRLAALGVTTGPWLRALKLAVLSGSADATPIRIEWRDRDGAHAMTRSVGELRPVVLDVVPGQRIGYATDLRFTEDNVGVLASLMPAVDRLFIETVFLDADRDHAARKNHLTAAQAGRIARRIGARSLVPMHFSPRYEHCPQALADEARAAWAGPDSA